MTACAHAQRLIPLFYDGELDGLARREVSDHVANCMACSRVLALFDRERELLQRMVDDQIAEIDFSGFWLEVESRLGERHLSFSERCRLWWSAWRPLWSWRTPFWATAATALLLIVLFVTKPAEEKKIEPRILVEDKSKSYGDSDTENMLIHGDNLIALKALEQDFAGKIKIYAGVTTVIGSAHDHQGDVFFCKLFKNSLATRLY